MPSCGNWADGMAGLMSKYISLGKNKAKLFTGNREFPQKKAGLFFFIYYHFNLNYIYLKQAFKVLEGEKNVCGYQN